MSLWGGFSTAGWFALQVLRFRFVCLLFLVCAFTTSMLIDLEMITLQHPHSLIYNISVFWLFSSKTQ